MGKVKIVTVGDEDAEKKLKNKKEAKKAAKKAASSVIPASEPESPPVKTEILNPVQDDKNVDDKKAKGKKKTKFAASKKKRSDSYIAALERVDVAKQYSLPEALDLLPKVHLAKFDETVELHINTTTSGISGTLTLPHGTGKKVRVIVASDEVLADVEKGKINFDILVASPAMMPKLAKVAKVLGPKGLMPSPKNGTIAPNPEELVKKFESGQVSYKTESKLPVLHVSVGKMSFGKDKLTENIKVLVDSVSAGKIKNVTLKSTMSPGIKLDTASL